MESSVNAIKILRGKVRFLIDMVKNCPEVRSNQNFMRRLNQIIASVPIVSKEVYDQQTFGEYADVTAMNLLASVTKSFGEIN